MPATEKAVLLTAEIADFLASCPSRAEFLKYHPSEEVQRRARELLRKNAEGSITKFEQRELDQYEYAEMLMRLVKVRLRSKKATGR
jgi:hypothetical protein